MKKIGFLVVLCPILFWTCFFPASAATAEKQVVFFEDFSDNSNNWHDSNLENAFFAIRDGAYHFSHNRQEGGWHVSRFIGIDEFRDFEIETTIKKVGGITNNGYGLIWGRKDPSNQFEFQVSGDGYFRIKKYVDNVPYDFVDWQTSPAVRTGNGSTNKLKIEKTNHLVHFFVNDIPVHTMQFEPFLGHEAGYVVYSQQQIAIDYLKVSQSRPDDLSFLSGSRDKVRIFSDEFNDNINQWPLDSSENAAFEMKGGAYSFEYFNENGWWGIYKEIPMDAGRDFEIEAKIKKISGIQNNGYGIIWGRLDNNNQFEFQISSNGYYKIKKIVDGNVVDIRPWTLSGAVNQGARAENRLNVVKMGGKVRYHINNAEVYATNSEPLRGNNFGFLIYQKQRIAMDYLHLSYLGENNFPVSDFHNLAKTEKDFGFKELQVKGSGASEPLAAGISAISAAGTRVALVIGNGDYIHGGSLKNPVNDARAMQSTLQGLGFVVHRHENRTQKEMKRAIDEFGAKLQGKDVGLFFYAGHGVQVNGANYLIPVDARLELENDVEYDCVRADRVLAKMEAAGSKTNIVILDACRDNPFERSWRRNAKSSGLAFMNAPSGSLIAYATSPGDTAADGAGQNGIYTGALLKHIDTPDISILQMFQKVRSEVTSLTGDRQTPWESTSLKGDFFFKQR